MRLSTPNTDAQWPCVSVNGYLPQTETAMHETARNACHGLALNAALIGMSSYDIALIGMSLLWYRTCWSVARCAHIIRVTVDAV